MLSYFKIGTHLALEDNMYFPIGFASGIKDECYLPYQIPVIDQTQSDKYRARTIQKYGAITKQK